MESSMSRQFVVYTQDGTLHGLAHITDTKRTRVQRIIWTMLVFIAIGGFIFAFVTGLLRFYDRQISTRVDHKTQSQIEFPSVTICNYNYVRKSYIDDSEVVHFKGVVDILNPRVQSTLNLSNPLTQLELSSVDLETSSREAAHLKKDMFLQCNFMSNTTESGCGFSDELLISVKTQMGFCFTFNPQSYIEKYGSLYSTRAGAAGGLHMRIDIQQNEYQIGSDAAGLKVLVHDPKAVPLVQELGTSVHPGTETNLVITRVELDNLPPPYEGSSCKVTNISQDPAFKNPLQYYPYYTYTGCLDECKTNYVLQRCQCINYNMNAENVPICKLFAFLTCSLPANSEYYANTSIADACECFHPCQETQYTVTQSIAYFPNQYVAPFIEASEGKSEEYYRKNVLDLNIFYGELGYTVSSQKPDYPASTLFAEVGGLLGLCLGASLLTVAEFCEMLILSMSHLTKWNSSKQKVQTIKVQPEKS